MEIDGFISRDPNEHAPRMAVGRWGKVVRNREAFWVRLDSVSKECVIATVDNQLVLNDLRCGQRLKLSKDLIHITVGEPERRAFVRGVEAQL